MGRFFNSLGFIFILVACGQPGNSLSPSGDLQTTRTEAMEPALQMSDGRFLLTRCAKQNGFDSEECMQTPPVATSSTQSRVARGITDADLLGLLIFNSDAFGGPQAICRLLASTNSQYSQCLALFGVSTVSTPAPTQPGCNSDWFFNIVPANLSIPAFCGSPFSPNTYVAPSSRGTLLTYTRNGTLITFSQDGVIQYSRCNGSSCQVYSSLRMRDRDLRKVGQIIVSPSSLALGRLIDANQGGTSCMAIGRDQITYTAVGVAIKVTDEVGCRELLLDMSPPNRAPNFMVARALAEIIDLYVR